MSLPFSVALDEFEMIPYSGTNTPRDFVADLSLTPLNPDTTTPSPTDNGQAKLNNPLVYQGIKLSQTGWDPGDRNDPNHQARDAQGRFTHQQRYSIMGVGNNVGIRVVFIGACLVVAGIPWAFYIKPLLVQRQKRRIQTQLAQQQNTTNPQQSKPKLSDSSTDPMDPLTDQPQRIQPHSNHATADSIR